MNQNELRLSRLTKSHEKGHKWPMEKRIEVVTKWMALGNMRLVSQLTGVEYQLCRVWKMQPWWDDIVAEVKASRNTVVDGKLSKIVDKSLAMIEDRLENGDVVWNRKTNELERRPVNLDTINKVAKTALEQQTLLAEKENKETNTQATQTIQDQIRFLAEEFAKFNTRRTINAIHDQRQEGLQEATEVRLEAGEYCEEERGQQSSSDYDEGGSSSQGGWEGRGAHQGSEQGWDDDTLESEDGDSTSQSFLRPDV